MVPEAAWRVARELARLVTLGEVHDLREGTEGRLNRTLFASTTRGRFVLKGTRYPLSEPSVREHAVMAAARRAGIPVPEPLVGRDGTTVLRAGRRWWVVLPMVAGTHVAPDDLRTSDAEALGDMLGRIHLALDSLPPALLRLLPRRPLWDRATTLEKIANIEAVIRARSHTTAFDAHALASLAYRRTLLTQPECILDFGVGGTVADARDETRDDALHGDFHGRNVIFDGEVVSAVLDWELASCGSRIWEVARAVDLSINLARDFADGASRFSAFLHAYFRHHDADVARWSRLPAMYRTSRIRALWVYEEHYRLGEAPTDDLAIDDLGTIDWWSQHEGAVVEIVREACSAARREIVT